MSLHLPRHLRNRHLFMLDASCSASVPWWPTWCASKASIGARPICYTALAYIVVTVPLKLGVLLYVGLYRRLWRFAGVAELEHILVATAISASISSLVGAALLPGLGITPYRVPLSVLFIDACLSAGAVALPRLFIRLLGRRTQWRQARGGAPGADRGRRRRRRDHREGAAQPSARSASIRSASWTTTGASTATGSCDLPVLGSPGVDQGPGAAVRRGGSDHRDAPRYRRRGAPGGEGRDGGGSPDSHGAGDLRHHLGPGGRGLAPRGRDPGPAPPRADPDRPGAGARPRHGRDGAGDRRRRLHRQRALPPARAAGAGPGAGDGPRRELDLRRDGGADRALSQPRRRSRSSATCATGSGCG